ncbi:MAG: YlbF family regulator [Bacilli bacterium]|nr:YlbF family regulator [Bacilli bacterium]
MRDKILNKVDEIIDIIRNSEEYYKYIEISNKLKEHEEIMGLIDDVKSLQKRLVKEESLNLDISYIDKEINQKLALLEAYPIYLEYIELQESLDHSIGIVKDGIEKYINNITN